MLVGDTSIDRVAGRAVDRAVPATGRVRSWTLIPCGLVAGAIWGAVARGWMRWVSTDPEFSWGGTLMIVIAFGIFGMAQAAVTASRRRGRRRRILTAVRVGGVIGTLPLFVGAGALMLPTVMAGGPVIWRSDWRRWVRYVFGAVALLPIVVVITSLVSDFGVLGAIPRSVGLVAIYGAVVAATWATFSPQHDGWRAPRRIRLLGAIGAGLFLLVVSVGLIGIG